MAKEKKEKVITIRVTEEELKLLKIASYTIGQKPSQLVRMFIDTTINALQLEIKKGVIKIEDFETILND